MNDHDESISLYVTKPTIVQCYVTPQPSGVYVSQSLHDRPTQLAEFSQLLFRITKIAVCGDGDNYIG